MKGNMGINIVCIIILMFTRKKKFFHYSKKEIILYENRFIQLLDSRNVICSSPKQQGYLGMNPK